MLVYDSSQDSNEKHQCSVSGRPRSSYAKTTQVAAERCTMNGLSNVRKLDLAIILKLISG